MNGEGPAPERIRSISDVAVIDHDTWRGRGVASAIGEIGGLLRSVGVATEPGSPALAAAGTWLVIGPAPSGSDRWPGLGVAAEAGATHPGPSPARLLLLGRSPHPVLLLRAHEVGVTAAADVDQVTTLPALESFLLTPPPEAHPLIGVDRGVLRALGLRLAARPQSLLDCARAEPGGPELDSLSAGLSRRASITLRTRLCAALLPEADGGTPQLLSWAELRTIHRISRGLPPTPEVRS